MELYERTADLAVVGQVRPVFACPPPRKSPTDYDWELMQQFAALRLARRLPRFDSDLARSAREADERRWRAAARAFAMGAYDWARLAEPTVERFAHRVLSIVETLTRRYAVTVRRWAVVPRLASVVLLVSFIVRLVMAMVAAACAPPDRVSLSLS